MDPYSSKVNRRKKHLEGGGLVSMGRREHFQEACLYTLQSLNSYLPQILWMPTFPHPVETKMEEGHQDTFTVVLTGGQAHVRVSSVW